MSWELDSVVGYLQGEGRSLSQVNPALASPGKQSLEQNGDIVHLLLGVKSLEVIRQIISVVITAPKKGVERQFFLSLS